MVSDMLLRPAIFRKTHGTHRPVVAAAIRRGRGWPVAITRTRAVTSGWPDGLAILDQVRHLHSRVDLSQDLGYDRHACYDAAPPRDDPRLDAQLGRNAPAGGDVVSGSVLRQRESNGPVRGIERKSDVL